MNSGLSSQLILYSLIYWVIQNNFVVFSEQQGFPGVTIPMNI